MALIKCLFYLIIDLISFHYSPAVTAGNERIFDDIEERVSAVKKPGESDMDFFERRFQERVSFLYYGSCMNSEFHLPKINYLFLIILKY